MIDLYRGVFGDRREPLLEAITRWPGSCGPVAWDALPYIQRLLATARESRIPVIHSTGLAEAESGVRGFSEAKVRDGTSRPSLDLAMGERNRQKYDLIDEVAPLPGEAVLRKASPSVFWGTPLAAHLKQLGVDTIIVAGESTSGCVRATVVDGCTYRYRMIVVEECVFDRHQAPHAINLFDLHQKYADVIELSAALEYLHQHSIEQRGPKAGDPLAMVTA
jgi:nicotinamidase-related amidase